MSDGTHDFNRTMAMFSGPKEPEITILRRNFAAYLAPEYLRDPVRVAAACDEKIDQSGALLGYVREEAAKIKRKL